MANLEEKTIKSQSIYQGAIINLRLDNVRLPNGQEAKREIVEHSGGVVVLPYQAEEVVLIKQFRKPVDKTLLEVPAGRLEPEESPEVCAQRELEEETGYRSEKLKKLQSFYTSPGFTDEKLHLYLATGLTEYEQNLDQNEFVKCCRLTLSEVQEKLLAGKIKDAKTIIALQQLLFNLSD